MNAKLLAAMAALLAGWSAGRGADDGAARDIEKAVRALNDAFEAGKADAIKALVTEDHLAITPYAGRQDFAEQFETLPDLKLTEYDTGTVQVKLYGDVAVATYPLTQKGTFRGKPVPTKCLASAVWVRQGGKWREAHYQETAVPEK